MRAPAVLLLLTVFGLAGCQATKWATYGGKNPSGAIIGVPLDIVTAPSQVADAVRRGEAQRRQEVLSAKISADPAVVLDPKVAADPANYRTILLWFDSLDEKTRPAFTEAQWTALLSPDYPLPLYGLALNKRRDAVVPAKVIEALLPVHLAACKASEREKGCGLRTYTGTNNGGADWQRLRSDYPTVFAAVSSSCKHGTGDILRARVRDEAAVAARDAEHRKAKEDLAKKKERLDALWVVYRKVVDQPSLIHDAAWRKDPRNLEALAFYCTDLWREEPRSSFDMLFDLTRDGLLRPKFTLKDYVALMSDEYPWNNWPQAPHNIRQLFANPLHDLSNHTTDKAYGEFHDSFYRRMIERCRPTSSSCPLEGCDYGPFSETLRIAERCSHRKGDNARLIRSIHQAAQKLYAVHRELFEQPGVAGSAEWRARPASRMYLRLYGLNHADLKARASWSGWLEAVPPPILFPLVPTPELWTAMADEALAIDLPEKAWDEEVIKIYGNKERGPVSPMQMRRQLGERLLASPECPAEVKERLKKRKL
ncbi:MAG: hypothetical protein RLZZ233_1835 [Verrucomicrobiota bacterium]|jgi:hypothetical protein